MILQWDCAVLHDRQREEDERELKNNSLFEVD